MSEETFNIIWLAGIPIFATLAIILIPYLMIRQHSKDYDRKMYADEFGFVVMFTFIGLTCSGIWFVFVPFAILGGIAWLCYQMYLRA